MTTHTTVPALRQVPAGGAIGGHIPVLDGIRGLAIGLVMLYHFTVMNAATAADRAWVTATGLGWVGVDLFFVLSGFLITGILWDAKGSDGYFRNFYARRTLRIFPLYYATVFACLVLLPHVLPAAADAAGSPDIAVLIRDKIGRLEGIQGHEIWFWLYLSNIPIAMEGTFLHSILGVSWSLAIEEQFYLVWPAVVWFCSRRRLLRVCAGLVGLALAWRLGLTAYLLLAAEPTRIGTIAIYASTLTHVDALGIGSFLAVAARGAGAIDLVAWARRARPVAAACAAVLVAVALIEREQGSYSTAYYAAGHGPVFQGVGLTLVSVLFGALLLMVLASRPALEGRRADPLNVVFMSGPLRTLGKYAYALYLFHSPLKALVRDLVYGPAGTPARFGFHRIGGSELPGQLLFYVLLFALSLGAAVVSWYTFELQFLKLKRYFPVGREKRAGEGLGELVPRVAAGVGGGDAASLASPR